MFLVCVEYDGSASHYGYSVQGLRSQPFETVVAAKMELNRRLNAEREMLENATEIVGWNGHYSFSGVDRFGDIVHVKGCVFRLLDVA